MNSKTLLSLAALVAVGSNAYAAQEPQNRTVSTMVADALALMPANNEQKYEAAMKTLVSAGDEGIDALGAMLKDLNAVRVNYALSGMAHYVTRPGMEEARKAFVASIGDELNKASSTVVKEYYIRLLAICAKDEYVAALGDLLANKELQAEAAQALISIGSAAAKAELVENLKAIDLEIAAQSIGAAKLTGQESFLMASYPDANLAPKKAIMNALGATGTKASLPFLWEKAAVAKFCFEPNAPTSSLLQVLSSLAKAEPAFVIEEAKKLLEAAKAAKQSNTMVAAVELMLAADASKVQFYILNAAISEDYIYRTGVLNLLADSKNDKLFEVIADNIAEASPAAQVAIINFLGDEHVAVAYDYVKAYINSADKQVAMAAMKSCPKMYAGAELINMLCTVMATSPDAKLIDTAAAALRYTKYGNSKASDYAAALAQVVEQGAMPAKVKAIELMAARRANSQAALVQSLLSSPEAALSNAAYKALAALATGAQMECLVDILLQAPAAKSADAQNALYAALTDIPEAQRAAAVATMLAKAGDKQNLLYSLLTRMGDLGTAKKIAAEFAAANPADKQIALNALMQWEGAPIYSLLGDMMKACEPALQTQLWGVYLNNINKQDTTPENKRLFATNVLLNSSDLAQQKAAIGIIAKSGSYAGLMTVAPFMSAADAGLKEAACQAVMKIALGNKSFDGPQVTAMLKECSEKLNNPDAGYNRESIAKHLAGIKADGGYVSMFNGSDLAGWKGLVGTPITRTAMTAEELASAQADADAKMKASWSAKNGALNFNGHGDNICTQKQYGDFEMLVDWRLDKAGKEADAGIYLRGTPQVQMWDISRTNVGAQVGSGGLYNNQKNPAKPSKLMDNELGEWNSFYIKMVGERVTVIMNGETVVDNVVLENYWDKNLPIFVKEQIELQAHGSEVEYKNLYIRELKAAEPVKLSEEEAKDGFKLLFNGTTFEHWQGNTTDYVAENNAMALYPERAFGGNLYTKKEYANFIFRFEFKLEPGTNNGVGIRTPMGVDAAYHGMEIQVLDDSADIFANIADYQHHGSVYGIRPAIQGSLKPVGEWNTEEIYANGNHIRVTVNGKVIVDVDIAEATENNTKTHDGNPHPGLLNKKGYIGFLGHGSAVQYRNLRIKELPENK